MKRPSISIALSLFAVIAFVSCKNGNNSEQTIKDEIEDQKEELTDSILSYIDELAEKYINASDSTDIFSTIKLSEDEKMIKPDYLLEPKDATMLESKFQKVNALAIYVQERSVRRIYDMPTDEADEAIARLIVGLNHPIDAKILSSNDPASEKIKKEYTLCRESGDLSFFWLFQNALMCETDYLISQNPDLFLGKVSKFELQTLNRQWTYFKYAVDKLAFYDDEMKLLDDMVDENANGLTDEEITASYATMEATKKLYQTIKEKVAERRKALLE